MPTPITFHPRVAHQPSVHPQKRLCWELRVGNSNYKSEQFCVRYAHAERRSHEVRRVCNVPNSEVTTMNQINHLTILPKLMLGYSIHALESMRSLPSVQRHVLAVTRRHQRSAKWQQPRDARTCVMYCAMDSHRP